MLNNRERGKRKKSHRPDPSPEQCDHAGVNLLAARSRNRDVQLADRPEGLSKQLNEEGAYRELLKVAGVSVEKASQEKRAIFNFYHHTTPHHTTPGSLKR